ncbi:MAG: acyl-CoA dehydrogenase family protein [Burkholderiales bacterium]|nr:acyl-CoA dehydrogenase family protein [Burkholderiales bacterium]
MTATHLEWPFFEDRHRDLAGRLDSWAGAHASELEHPREDNGNIGDVDASTRKLAALLGRSDWLKVLATGAWGGPSPTIDVRSLCLIRETLASHSGIADCAFAIQGLGSAPISLFGSELLQHKYLPGIFAGERYGAFGLSEPEAGSDVSALTTTARADGDGFVLNGFKTWISNAPFATHYIVFARSSDEPGARGLSAFVVDAGTPGVRVSERLDIIAPHSIGSLTFEDCRIPACNLLGRSGDGFKIAMSTLDIFRPTVGAAALGMARRALSETIARVGERKVFGQALAQHQATQMRVADMAVDVDAAALLVYRAAWAKDCMDRRVTLESAMAKMQATELAQHVIDSAVQLFGGMGVTKGSVVERLYREIRPLRIYEGTSEIQKIIIATQLLGKN